MSVGVAKAVKSPKARKAAKPSHPPYKNMAKAAVKNLKEQGGSSRQAILKYIVANYKVGDEKKANTRLCLALKKGVSSGVLAHSKGSGAAGSFTIAKSGKTVAKKTTKRKSKAKKPAVKKAVTVKKPAVKKASKPKKPKAKKAKKPAAKKSPAKKPAARKSRKARK